MASVSDLPAKEASKLDVLSGVLRNSKTAWRNSAAPSCAVASVPPSASMNSRSRPAATASSARSLARESTAPCDLSAGRWRKTSAVKAENRTSVATEAAVVAMARCRKSPYKSRNRAPTPTSQCCKLSWQTPTSLATAAGLSPRRSRHNASITTSTPVTFPGSTSHGRTLSRRPQRRQTASAIEQTLNASNACSLRDTRLPVRRGPRAEQREQQQASSRSSTFRGSARSSS